MSSQLVHSSGIYHGLPTFPEDVRGLTAIITGANGISGYHMLKVLAQSPQRWTKIYCLSRRPPAIPGGLPPNAKHIACDFLKEPQEIADVMKKEGVQADHVFFYSYVQVPPKEGGGLWSDAEEMARVNHLLLKNFLEALAVASIKPQKIMLQTGAKNYGVHLGPAKAPMEEWDPRIEFEPNFYYSQEDELWSYCEKRDIGWTIGMPASIWGAVPDAAMNVALPIAIYASVCRHRREPLAFFGDRAGWQAVVVQSSAMLNGYLEEWSVLTEAAKNQKFNACDNSAFSNESFWPRLAGWYGIEWTGPQTEGLKELTGGYDPPPRGYGPKGSAKYSFLLTDWARRPEIQQAWKEIAEQNDLVLKEFYDIDRIFGFSQRFVIRGDSSIMSMDKSRKLGWHGFVDSSESMLEVFDDFAKLKMIPPVPKKSVKFL